MTHPLPYRDVHQGANVAAMIDYINNAPYVTNPRKGLRCSS